MNISTSSAAAPAALDSSRFSTLEEFLNDTTNLPPALVTKKEDLILLFAEIEKAVVLLAESIRRAGLEDLTPLSISEAAAGTDRDAQKPLDVLANEIFCSSLSNSGVVSHMASEEADEPITVQQTNSRSSNINRPFVVVFDPLDGSRNIEASIPTGSIFGVYETLEINSTPLENVMQPGHKLIASGYSLYSSACLLVLSFGAGSHVFTLDTRTNRFRLTKRDLKIPKRGQIYSVNDARYFDWPEGLKKYIDKIRQGEGESGKQYSARYVCSLVADFHRTLLYGGVAMNPRSHLRLVYEANPMAFLAEQSGGKGSNGISRVLDIIPQKLHQRLPLFLGSELDILELESHGDVQQIGEKKYTV